MSDPEQIFLGKSDFVLVEKKSIVTGEMFSNSVELDLGQFALFLANGLPCVSDESKKTVIVGEIYDPGNPTYSNQIIVDGLSEKDSFIDLVKALSTFGGRYFVIAFVDSQWHLLGDACGQFELFYHESVFVFASNVSLVSACHPVEDWADEPKLIYEKINKGDEIPIGKSTRCRSVKHLLPNHFVVSGETEQRRYFPTSENPVRKRTIDEVLDQTAAILTGLIQAFSKRYPLALPVTAGYDSRLLLAAAKGIEAQTFIFRHPQMASDFYDIQVARQLCEAVGRDFDIISYDSELIASKSKAVLSESTRKFRESVLINGMKKHFSKKLFLSGNIGEIGRTYYGDLMGVNEKMLARIIGFGKSDFVRAEMLDWLESLDRKSIGKQNLLNLFYWEMRMGTWGALAMTEYAAVSPVVSPMNSHQVLSGFLGLNKKYRSYYYNKLFDGLIQKMDPRLIPFPLNPNRKTSVIKFLVKLGLYNLYRNLLFRIQS